MITRGAVSPDHIHVLVSCELTMASAKLVQDLKGRSSRKLHDEFPEFRKRYWGQHPWARGYFCSSVEAMGEETIKKYIEADNGMITTTSSRSLPPSSLEPALRRALFRPLQPQSRFSVETNSTGFSR